MDTLTEDLELAELDASRGHPNLNIDSRRGADRSDSISSHSSSPTSEAEEGDDMSRIETQYDLERHPTALSRIATQRSQHFGTVGAGTRTHIAKRPLPPFGAGKPYPPPLPEKEAYVVEFDGPDDPLHPQNWPFKRKYARECPPRGRCE
jgi:DHA1 family multidrug resistance protein-like MFS transporter